MARDEILEHAHPLAQVGLDGQVDDPARGVGHQPAHPGQLVDLGHVSAGTGVGDHPDRPLSVEPVEHVARDLVRRLAPDVYGLLVALVVGDEAAPELAVDLRDACVRVLEDLALAGRDRDVVNADRQPRQRGVVEANRLDAVDQRRGGGRPKASVAVRDERLERLAVHGLVQEAEPLRQDRVEHDPTRRGRLQAEHGVPVLEVALPTVGLDLDGVVDAHRSALEGHDHFRVVDEGLARLLLLGGQRLLARLDQLAQADGQVVAAQHHVVGGADHRGAVGGGEQVLGGEHQLASFLLGGRRERHMHRHLVAIEVRVEREANERVDLDRRALDEHRHEGLDAQAVERGRPV